MKYELWLDDNLTEEEWDDIIESHSDNYQSYLDNEMKRINNLDEMNRNQQIEQLLRVMDEMQKLEELEWKRNESEAQKQAKKAGLEFLKSNYTAEQLREKWKKVFVADLSEDEKKECEIEEFLWNVFTFGMKTDFLEGDEANKAFSNKIKERVYVFYQHEDAVYYIDTHNKLELQYLRFQKRAKDMFLVDEKFTWTFIYKHCDQVPIWYEKK